MKKLITTVNNWGNITFFVKDEEVDPNHITSIVLEFPDKTRCDCPVTIGHRTSVVSDHGHESTVYSKILSVTIPIYGAWISYDLEELPKEIKVVEVKMLKSVTRSEPITVK